MLVLGVCVLHAMPERWPQIFCMQMTTRLLPTNWFVSTRTNSMECVVNCIALRIRVRSRNTQY